MERVMPMSVFRIYLSGGMTGLSYEEQIKWRNQIISAIRLESVDCNYIENPVFFSPPEYYSPDTNFHKSEKEAMEYELNWLRKSDLVIVNFNTPNSIGTAMELAIAKENKIPVVGVNIDNKELHSWLIECTTRMCESLREAVDYIKKYYLSV